MNNLKKSVFFALAYGLCMTSAQAASLGSQWYIGIGGGSSWLQPNPRQIGLDIDSRLGTGGNLFFGADFDDRSSGQLTVYGLGEAELDTNELVSYQAFDGSVVYRLFDTKDTRLTRSGMHLALYGRFALGVLNRDTDVSLSNDSSVYFGAGGGAEWFITNAFSARLEGIYLDEDAFHGSLQLVGRFGGRARASTRPPSVPQPNPTSAQTQAPEVPSTPETPTIATPPAVAIPDVPTTPADSTEQVEALEPVEQIQQVESVELIEPAEQDNSIEQIEPVELPAQEGLAELIEPVEPTLPSESDSTTLSEDADQDGDNVPDASDQCLASPAGYPVRSTGCALLDGVLSGVDFVAGSSALLPDATKQLDVLSNLLVQYSQAKIEIHTHSDNSGTVAGQTALTRARVRTIGAYLVRQGVSVDRLVLRSFGASRPLFDSDSAEGQSGNNRVEVIESRN